MPNYYSEYINCIIIIGLSWYRAGFVRPNVNTFFINNLLRNCDYFFRIICENAIGQSEPLTSEQAIKAKPTFSKLKIFNLSTQFKLCYKLQ